MIIHRVEEVVYPEACAGKRKVLKCAEIAHNVTGALKAAHSSVHIYHCIRLTNSATTVVSQCTEAAHIVFWGL